MNKDAVFRIEGIFLTLPSAYKVFTSRKTVTDYIEVVIAKIVALIEDGTFFFSGVIPEGAALSEIEHRFVLRYIRSALADNGWTVSITPSVESGGVQIEVDVPKF